MVTVDYTNPHADRPAAPAKYLAAMTAVGDCTTAPSSSAEVVALFNNVRVNP